MLRLFLNMSGLGLIVTVVLCCPRVSAVGGPHAFRSACEQIYGEQPVDAHLLDIDAVSDALKAKKKTVDALIHASLLVLGTNDNGTCAMHEKVLAKLHGLELSSLELSDLSPLTSLTRLEELTLDHDGIVDLTAVSELTNLKSLDVSGNQVVDISPLRNLVNLVEFRAIANKIVDVNALSHLNKLVILHLESNNIEDVKPLASLPQAMVLFLDNNHVQSIDSLSGLPRIVALGLNGNRLEEITQYKPVTQVGIDLSNNSIPSEQLEDLVRRDGGDKALPGQVTPLGRILVQWHSGPYSVPELPNSGAYVNHTKTILACTIPNDQGRGSLPKNWPTCTTSNSVIHHND